MTSLNTSEAGFTLVEMMVAVLIFAVLAVAGVGLLRASIETQVAVDNRLDGVNGQERVVALFTADLGQATARPQMDIGARKQIAFRGTSSSVSLIRGGWANPDELPRSSLQRVEWTGSQSNVSRVAHLLLDGSDSSQPAIFHRGVETFALRYRRADGGWTESFSSTEREMLPIAVELTIRPRGGPPLIIVAALPPRGLEPDAKTPSAEFVSSGIETNP